MSFYHPDLDFLPRQPRSRRAPDPIWLSGYQRSPLWASMDALETTLPPLPAMPIAETMAKLKALREADRNWGTSLPNGNASLDEVILSSHWPRLRQAWIQLYKQVPAHGPDGPDLLAAALTLGDTELALDQCQAVHAKPSRVSADQAGKLLARWARSATSEYAPQLLEALSGIFDGRLSHSGFLDSALDAAAVAGSLPALEAVLAAHPHPEKEDGLGFPMGPIASAFDEAFNACAVRVCERLLASPRQSARFARHIGLYAKHAFTQLHDPNAFMDTNGMVKFPRSSQSDVLDMLRLISRHGQGAQHVLANIQACRLEDMGPLSSQIQAIALELATPPAPVPSRGIRL